VAEVIDLTRPEAQQTRAELSLKRIAQAWQRQSRGQAFIRALLGFLKGLSSQRTLRSYSFAIIELFGWYEREKGRMVTPDLVTRADASDFAHWLRDRQVGLDIWRLKIDPTRDLDLEIVRIISREPGADIDLIRRELMRFSRFTTYHGGERILRIDDPSSGSSLGQRLACLARIRTLYRTPTIEQLRRRGEASAAEPPSDDIFRYFPPRVKAEPGPSRASSMVTRLGALSSYWTYMTRGGENVPGQEEPLLRHNIWLGSLRVAQRQAPSHRAEARARKTPSLDLALRLLATTFYRTHGTEQAMAAAKARMWGRRVPAGVLGVEPSFKDLRDQLLLLIMVQIGGRASEISQARRKDISGDLPVISLIGKGGKRRSLRVPLPTMIVYRELSEKLDILAGHQQRRGAYERADVLLQPDAPLVPAIAYWGVNAEMENERGLSRSGIARMLRRRAIMAGMEPGSATFAKIHPHGMRHLFAQMAASSGTPMNVIQAMLGHAYLSTTGIYTEERDPERLMSEAFRAPPEIAVRPSPEQPSVRAWQPERQEISAPRMRQRDIKPGKVREPKPMELGEAPGPVPPRPEEEPTAAPAVAAPPLISSPTPSRVEIIERARDRPVSEQEEQELLACEGVDNEALRRLCEIYELHWGEVGDRQPLIKGKGIGHKLAANPEDDEGEGEITVEEIQEMGWKEMAEIAEMSGIDISDLDASEEEDIEELRDRLMAEVLAEEEDEDEEERQQALEEERRVRRREAEEAVRVAKAERELYSEGLTRKAHNIFSGKSSGLSWWTGTMGKLKPEMPVMSPRQVGSCTASEQDPICRELIRLWHSWAKESIVKADALVLWVREALDTSAQMETELLKRERAQWIAAGDSWGLTKVRGTKRHPEPRQVFREHVEKEVVAWFRRVAWQYRESPGSPEAFDKAARASKVIDTPPPPWFDRPIRSLPGHEREELLDWLRALTGELPQSLSRREVAECIHLLCSMDGKIDSYREEPDRGPAFVSRLWKHTKVGELPVEVRGELGDLQRDARAAFSRATMGKVRDFDAWGAIRSRIRGKRKVKGSPEAELDLPRARWQWYLRVIGQVVSKDAAKDPILKLVAQCGDAPLSGYKELLRVDGGNIAHQKSYISYFARKHGAHSECVARRIARQLWEYRKANPRGEYVTRPAHMVNLVKVMQAMRVPCDRNQQLELERILGRPDNPEGIYAEWMKAQTGGELADEGLGEEIFQIFQEAGEGFSQAQAGELLSGATFSGAEGYQGNPRGLMLPSPVILMLAVMS
jgi:integrase